MQKPTAISLCRRRSLPVATGLVVSETVEAPDDIPVVRVADTQVAYGRIARVWRDKFDIPVVGVTGSVGKTTTKEMLAATLSPLGPVLKTAASQNNETGVPKALLQMTDAHKAAVIEMGMRGSGQIEYLCDIARPTVGVVTIIGENHIELLGSLDAIADAKGELLASLPADGVAVINADDPYAAYLIGKTAARVMTWGVTSEADYRADDLAHTDDAWRFSVRGVRVEIASASRHDVGNALAALAVAETLGVALPAAAHALAAYTPEDMRMQVLRASGSATVLNDAYNAAPASVRSALHTLTAMRPGQGRRIAFLGDMKELGEHGPQAHWDLSNVIAALGGLHALYAVGALAAQIPGATEYFPDSAAAAQFAERLLTLEPDDVVLVKGSRAMAMERVVEALIGKPEVKKTGADEH